VTCRPESGTGFRTEIRGLAAQQNGEPMSPQRLTWDEHRRRRPRRPPGRRGLRCRKERGAHDGTHRPGVRRPVPDRVPSLRAGLPRPPVPRNVLAQVLLAAGQARSSRTVQPWWVTVVIGSTWTRRPATSAKPSTAESLHGRTASSGRRPSTTPRWNAPARPFPGDRPVPAERHARAGRPGAWAAARGSPVAGCADMLYRKLDIETLPSRFHRTVPMSRPCRVTGSRYRRGRPGGWPIDMWS
jgi:hypothetical protein